jgi:peptide/nickel transport system permease protein
MAVESQQRERPQPGLGPSASPVPGARPASAAGHWAQAWRRLRRDRAALVAGAAVLGLIAAALFADALAPYDYALQDMANRYAGPAGAHPLGTDHLGRDVLSRLMYGARISLAVGLIAVGIAVTFGVTIGAVAGYFGGQIDLLLMWVMDLILAFPGLLLAIAIASALGPSVTNAMIAIGIVNIPAFARLVRSSVLTVRGQEFVEAARAVGAGSARIIALHVIPNVLAVVIVRATVALGFAILTEAGLSFIGLGAQPPDPSWGGMLNDGRESLRRAAHLATFPGLCIMATVLAFNVLGDGLRDALDPRLKR